MNCKPGDIALWVTRGCLVEVLRVHVAGDYQSVCGGWYAYRGDVDPAWAVRCLGAPQVNFHWNRAFMELPVYDGSLRPIRDQDGTDETLTWAGKPQAAERSGFTKVMP